MKVSKKEATIENNKFNCGCKFMGFFFSKSKASMGQVDLEI
jgi:hypothetical protein